jgi:hypothetical protein
MKLLVANGMLTSGSVARLIAIGWFCGVGSLALVVLVLAALVGPLIAGLEHQLQMPSLRQILPLLMLPVVLALQAVMVGAVGAFGVWIYKRYRRLELQFAPGDPRASSL